MRAKKLKQAKEKRGQAWSSVGKRGQARASEGKRYTQDSCSNCFRNGRPLTMPIQDLLAGVVHPLKDDGLAVDVVENGDKIWSIDKRRLYCFKEYQKCVGSQEAVIRVRLHTLHRRFDRFLEHESASNDGTRNRRRSHWRMACVSSEGEHASD